MHMRLWLSLLVLTLSCGTAMIARAETDPAAHGQVSAAEAAPVNLDSAVMPAHDADAVDAATAGHDAAAGHEGDHESKKGLPQMDPRWYISQFFWLIVTFLSLFVFLSRGPLAKLGGTLQLREDTVSGALRDAEALQHKAEGARMAYEKALHEARVQSTALFQSVESDIKARIAAESEEFRARAAATLEKAEQSIARAKSAAVEQMNATAAVLASTAAEKLIGLPADLDQAKTVIKNINKKAA